MHKLLIHKLGPIKDCQLDCTQFITLTGFQASGKSTIAKAVFFFRTIKNDILKIAEKKALENYYSDNMEKLVAKSNKNIANLLIEEIREKFMRVFGSSYGMDNDMTIQYYYTDEIHIKISLINDNRYKTPNIIWIHFSPELKRYLKKNNMLEAGVLGVPEIEREKLKKELNVIFDDNFETIYIPAGRSMITLLSSQMSFIYSNMNNIQKRSMDYCTRDYIERILTLKSEFSEGLDGIIAQYGYKNNAVKSVIEEAYSLIPKILKGQYTYTDSEERIVLNNGRYVKINFASSGQQESVWILNLIFYYLVKNEPVLFIVEEPESNLFPESQKYIIELISLLNNSGNSVIVTTHSPYVLGALNNLLYANQIPQEKKEYAEKVISKQLWINYNNFNALFVRNGIVENCLDDEIKLIQNEKIDSISKTINNDYDKLFDLMYEDEEGENYSY